MNKLKILTFYKIGRGFGKSKRVREREGKTQYCFAIKDQLSLIGLFSKQTNNKLENSIKILLLLLKTNHNFPSSSLDSSMFVLLAL